MKLDHYSYTNQGSRKHNEDAVGVRVYEDRAIFVVADGLGGHKKGEVASERVVGLVLEAFRDEEPSGRREDFLSSVLAAANADILKMQDEQRCVMKSTAVVLAIDGNSAAWAHVGDSRLYYIHGSELAYITHDHSVAYKKYAAGEITRFQINTDEDQATLLRSLGSKDRHEAEICREPVTIGSGDAFMLCSDGVWEYLHDDEVLVDYLKAEDARDWAMKLLVRIMDRIDGSNDNLSIITVIAE